MKYIILLIVFLLLANIIKAQVVMGNIVDENGVGLSGVELQLYINPNVYNTTTLTDGSFVFNNVTGVDEGQLPTGYAVTNNFPNPFNPTTRIGITLPSTDNVKIEVFNMLGQSVMDRIERTFSMGTNYVDIELNGLSNGFYIAKITIDDNHTVIKKMMLIYGSQHLMTSGGALNYPLNKSGNAYLETNIDSLVATSTIIGRKTFTNLPAFNGGTLDLGNLTVERYCPGTPVVTYEGKTYNTVQIGSQCWLKENLDVGTMIQGSADATDNGVIEKYCYGNDPNNCATYGGLYQWNEAMQYSTFEGSKGICPTGWHIPTYAEFQTLSTTVSADGNALKDIGQGTGTNTSGFSALLAGARYSGGYFDYLGIYSFFWSSTQVSASTAITLSLDYYGSNIYSDIHGSKDYGWSVRCLKD